jgi:hypothetical protein
MLIIPKVNIIVTAVTVMGVTAAVATAVPITRGIITQNTHGSGATIGRNILVLNRTLTQALV